jgi:type II secretory pathway pseudopilin PulG
MERVKGQAGMSLVEATIILLVLMLLTGVLAPSIFDYVRDAQMVKVKEDCEAIGLSVVRLTRDVGPCLKVDAPLACTMVNRVEILVSRGPALTAGDVTATPYTSPDMGGVNWDASVAPTIGDSMENQFTTNAPVYPTPGVLGTWNHTFPSVGLGWRGVYLASPIGPDPWGMPYLVNSHFLAVASNAPAGTGEGQRNGGWDRDVFCLSAGPNKLFETPYAVAGLAATAGTYRGNDDFTYVISGDTR